jgi:hypothetical protein
MRSLYPNLMTPNSRLDSRDELVSPPNHSSSSIYNRVIKHTQCETDPLGEESELPLPPEATDHGSEDLASFEVLPLTSQPSISSANAKQAYASCHFGNQKFRYLYVFWSFEKILLRRTEQYTLILFHRAKVQV